MNETEQHEQGRDIVLSFVVIGFNEAATLRGCLEAVEAAKRDAPACELIYVDGGSTDDSGGIAERVGVDRLLGGDRPRKAAENRNLGLEHARGRYVQFVDGDMLLDPAWPKAAMTVLEERPDVAVVFGQLRERNPSLAYRALQIDWEYPEGEALYCGGAALWRREVLEQLGGFPEDVRYGEEPLLCWRLRNELGRKVYHLHHRMASHDLGYEGLMDYWRRNIHCGEALAEVSARCRDTHDPFWTDERNNALLWAGCIVVALLTAFAGPGPLGWLALAALIAILVRKQIQYHERGWDVALVYALHVYASKLAIAYGILKTRLFRPTHNS